MQGTWIHAFIPGLCIQQLEEQIVLGNVYGIKNFTVQAYKPSDIYRLLRSDFQLIFSKDTKIQDVEDLSTGILHDMFDFFDLGEIKTLADQKTYLAGKFSINNFNIF